MLSFLGSAASTLLGGIPSTIANVISTKKTNEANQAINQSQIDYARSTTQEQWERDDNAHQREVKDLEAAGLSPLANTSGSPVTQANQPSGMIAMQAPQIDANAIINAIAADIGANQRQQQIEETIRHNKETEGFKATELANQATQLKNEADKISIENKKVEQQIKYQAGLLKIQADELNEKTRAAKKQESLKELEDESKRFYQEILKQSGGREIPYKEVNDINLYKHDLQTYITAYQIFINKIGATQVASGSSSSSSKNSSGHGGLNLGVPINGITGASGGLSGSGSKGSSSSDSSYDSKNISKKQEEMIQAWQKEHPIPIYIDLQKYPHHRNKEY